MRRFGPATLVVTLVFGLLAACADPGSAASALGRQIAAGINGDFGRVRTSLEDMVAKIGRAPYPPPPGPADLARLDSTAGGAFKLFHTAKGAIYYKSAPGGCAWYINPGEPADVSAALRQRILELQPWEDWVKQAFQAVGEFGSSSFLGTERPTTIALLYPDFDITSILPPGLRLADFAWYQRGARSSGDALWSPQPFTDLANGWVMDLAMPVIRAGKTEEVAVLGVNLAKLASRWLSSPGQADLLLLGGDQTIVAVSTGAKRDLGPLVLEDFDYVKQMRENTFAGADLTLGGTHQPARVQAIAPHLSAGELSFPLAPGPSLSRALAFPLPEVGFTLLVCY